MPREPDTLPDWFVGGAGKRRLLAALVSRDPNRLPWNEAQPWSKAVLARAAELHEKHTVFRHLDVLVLAGLLTENQGTFRFNGSSALLGPLTTFLEELERLPRGALPPSRGAG